MVLKKIGDVDFVEEILLKDSQNKAVKTQKKSKGIQEVFGNKKDKREKSVLVRFEEREEDSNDEDEGDKSSDGDEREGDESDGEFQRNGSFSGFQGNRSIEGEKKKKSNEQRRRGDPFGVEEFLKSRDKGEKEGDSLGSSRREEMNSVEHFIARNELKELMFEQFEALESQERKRLWEKMQEQLTWIDQENDQLQGQLLQKTDEMRATEKKLEEALKKLKRLMIEIGIDEEIPKGDVETEENVEFKRRLRLTRKLRTTESVSKSGFVFKNSRKAPQMVIETEREK